MYSRVIINGVEHLIQGGQFTGFVHTQSIPAYNWEIVLPMPDAKPIIQTYDTQGFSIQGAVEYLEPGKYQVSFATAETGTAIIISLI